MKGATGHDGTVDQYKVEEWSGMYADANTALRADGWIGLDVDAYDGKTGDQTLAQLEAELGELPITISSTSRGPEQPSRIHFYRIPESKQRFITKFTDLEIIQRSHRYAIVWPSRHPETGEQYRFYGYEGEVLDNLPAIDDLEELPEAWLERLSLPDLDIEEGAGYSGTVNEWLERAPQGGMGFFIADRVAQIPKSDFGHDVLISLQASIVAQAAAGDTGAKEALGTLRKEWLRGEYNTDEYARAFDAGLESAIRKFGALPDRPEDILTTDQVAAAIKIQHADFLSLWTSLPAVVTEASLRERVARVMSIAFDEGLSALEAASLGWHSSAAQNPEHGIRRGGLQALWDLMTDVAANPVGSEQKFAPDPDEVVEEIPLLPQRSVELLTQAEAARRSNIHWWGDEFMDVMREWNNPINEQYFHLSMWVILSLVFAPRAYLRRKNNTKLTLNFYCALVGPSNSGKSESFEIIRDFMRVFEFGDEWDLGGDATAAALTQALIKRHQKAEVEGSGRASLLHPDEADATIRNWSNNQGEFRGMPQRITDIYGGNVPALQRATLTDISGVHARAFLNVILTGVPESVADAIEPRMWETGFINRFVWAVGDRAVLTDDQMMPDFLDEGEAPDAGEESKWITAWASRLSTTSFALGEDALIEVSPEVKRRHVVVLKQLAAMAANSGRYQERLSATFGRLEKTIFKCAALVAIVNNRRRIEMDDYIVALEQAEEWIENILTMVAATNESPRARQAEKLFDLIAQSPGRRLPLSAILDEDEYSGESKFTEGLLRELLAQRRVDEINLTHEGAEKVYRVITKEEGTK